MKLKSDDFEIDLLETPKRSRFLRPPGWYWQEIHLPPKGPFASLGDVLRDLTNAVETGELAEALRAQSEAFEARRVTPAPQAEERGRNTRLADGRLLAGGNGVRPSS